MISDEGRVLQVDWARSRWLWSKYRQHCQYFVARGAMSVYRSALVDRRSAALQYALLRSWWFVFGGSAWWVWLRWQSLRLRDVFSR